MKTLFYSAFLALVSFSAFATTTIIDDTFTGSAGDLTAHTGPLGETWTQLAGGANAIKLSGSGTVYNNVAGTAEYYVNNEHGSTINQTIFETLNFKSSINEYKGFFGWADTGLANAYIIFVNAPGNIFLYKNVSGTSSLVTSASGLSIGNGDVISLQLSAGSQIVKVNSTTVITATDSAVPTPTPSTMVSGLWFDVASDTTTTGWHVDEFKVVDNGGPPLTNNAPQIINHTTTTVTLASQPVNGSPPYTYAWYSSTTPNFTAGSGNVIAGQTASNITITVTGTRQFVRSIVTDSASSSQTSYQRPIEAARDNSISIAFAGDSTSVEPGYGTNDSDVTCQYIRTRGGFANVNNFNYAVNGSSTAQWLPGQADLIAFQAAVANITNRWVISLRLGVNDAQASFGTNTFFSNMTNIIATMLTFTNTNGVHPMAIFVHYPTWREPGFFSAAAGTFDEVYSTFIWQYVAFIPAMANHTTVFVGDTTSLDEFAMYPTIYMAKGGQQGGGDNGAIGFIHPNPYGAQVMGNAQGQVIWSYLYPQFTGVGF